MHRMGALVVVLLLAACGASEPVIKIQLHLVQGTSFETLLEGTAELDRGRIEQAIKDRPLPIDLQAVITREADGPEFDQQTITFRLIERDMQYVLIQETPSGAIEPIKQAKEEGLEPFLKAAANKIAEIANVERTRMGAASP
jgi:hypothetical protein